MATTPSWIDAGTSVIRVDSAQEDRVIVTRRGEPAAVLVGVEGKDRETVVLETSSAFWDLIEKRRRESTLSAEELEDRLG